MSFDTERFDAATNAYLNAFGLFRADRYSLAPAEGEWSAAYVMHHIADGELHFATRYMHILVESDAILQPFSEELYPVRAAYAKRNVESSYESFVATRRLVRELLSATTKADWERTATHTEAGKVTLAQVFNTGSNHLTGHAQHLLEIAQKLHI